MKLFLLYFNAFLYSLAVLCVTFNCTTGIPSRDKRDLQENLNKFEITIQNLLRPHHGSSKKGGSARARMFDNSLESNNLDKQAHRDGKFEERLVGSRPSVPEAIDMAFQPQKQRSENQKAHRKFVPELDEESEGRHEKQEEPFVSESTYLDTSGEEDDEGEAEQKHSTKEKIKNNPVKDDRNKIKNNKKDFEVSLHEPRRKNSTSLNDSFVPDSIDLAFSNGPTRKSSTRTTTAKPTTVYWPPTGKYKEMFSLDPQ